MVSGSPAGVLLLTLNSSLGGTEKSLLSVCGNLDKRLFRPCIATLVGDGSLVRLARERGIDAVHLDMRGSLDLRVILRLWELMRERQISIVHAFLYHTCILGRLLGWSAMVPVVLCSQRSTDDWRSWFHVALDRWTQYFVTRYVANCDAVARRLLAVERIAPAKIHVIRTGIQPLKQAGPACAADLRKKWNIPANARVLGTVANLRPAKGHRILIEAAKKVLAEFPDTVFVWVGDGDLRQELSREISRQGLDKNFRLVGFAQDTQPYYAMFDIFVLPSLWEGLPLAFMEAMSLGLPIVVTKAGGVPEIATDSQDCLLVEPNDADALAAALTDLLRSPEKSERLGMQAKARFAHENSLDACVRQIQDLYSSCLREKSR